jgi:hypothetical protein
LLHDDFSKLFNRNHFSILIAEGVRLIDRVTAIQICKKNPGVAENICGNIQNILFYFSMLHFYLSTEEQGFRPPMLSGVIVVQWPLHSTEVM